MSQNTLPTFKSVDEFFELLEKYQFGNGDEDEDKIYFSVAKCANDFSTDWKIQCIERKPSFIFFLDDPTEELCRLAVEKDGTTICSVPWKFRTPELYHLAVSRSGLALEHVPRKLKTLELCRLAVENCADAINFVPGSVMEGGRAFEYKYDDFFI
ncbi:MAG: hypothetical protein AAB966_02690 [Patescibacteria group bacterium]